MRLSIVSDEISSDLDTVVEILQDCHCKEYVLRQLGLDTVPTVDERWISMAEKALQVKRIKISALEADPFTALKDVPPQTAEIFIGGYHAGLLALALRLQCNLISIVPPENSTQSATPEWLGLASVLCASAADAKIQIALKTRHQTLATTLAQIEAIGAPNLGLDWDVAGAFGSGDGNGMEGIESALPKLKLLRVCDGIRKGRGADWVALGKGVLPWEDILELLFASGYRGPVVLEPRTAPKLKEARAGLSLVARWIDACRIARRPDDEDGDAGESKRAHRNNGERGERGDRHGKHARRGGRN